MRVSGHESGDVRRTQQGEIRSPVLKSLQQELSNERHVVLGRCRGPSEIPYQIAVKPGGDLRTGIIRDWRRTRLHDAFLAKHGQHPIQRFRVSPTNTPLSATPAQESIHHVVVQSFNRDLFVLQPPAEIGDGDDLPSDRVMSIALFGDGGRVRVEVFAQRTLAKPCNRTCKGEELVYHPSMVPSGVQNYAAPAWLKSR
jgi:hypothetical protein